MSQSTDANGVAGGVGSKTCYTAAGQPIVFYGVAVIKCAAKACHVWVHATTQLCNSACVLAASTVTAMCKSVEAQKLHTLLTCLHVHSAMILCMHKAIMTDLSQADHTTVA